MHVTRNIATLLLCFNSVALSAAVPDAELSKLTADLAGPDAPAESRAARKLVELGDAAVPALAAQVRDGKALPPRLIAVELLGQIGTPAALDALLGLLPQEKNMAVRGQLCIQLGYAREKRAIPIIAQWLKTIGPGAIDDVRGGKEIQPSTCYLRHIEALGMIGDERAIPMLQEFAAKIPPNIGYGGFLSNFVKGGVNEALEEIRDQSAYWNAVRKRPGLEEKLAPIFAHFARDPLARLRLHASEVFRHTDKGKAIVQRLATHSDAAPAAAAKALLDNWDAIAN